MLGLVVYVVSTFIVQLSQSKDSMASVGLLHILIEVEMLLVFHISLSLSAMSAFFARASLRRDDCAEVFEGTDFLKLFPNNLYLAFQHRGSSSPFPGSSRCLVSCHMHVFC